MSTQTQSRDEVIASIKEQIKTFNLTAFELDLSRTRGTRRTPVAIKYQDDNGNQWTGRGKQATWVRKALENGAKLEDFLVKKTEAVADQAGA